MLHLNEVFRRNYSDRTWDDVIDDSRRVRGMLAHDDVVRITTPGIGFSDTIQASTTIAAIRDSYNPTSIVVNCYQPSMFVNNPWCSVATNVGDPMAVRLDSWPPHKLPPGEYPYGPMNLMTQWNIRVGLYDVPGYTRCEFYPTDEEIAWGRDNLSELEPYVAIQTVSSPSRDTYNLHGVAPISTSSSRARTSEQVDWPPGRWGELVDNLLGMGYNILQVGGGYEPIVSGAVDMTHVGPRHTFLVMEHAALAICQLSFPMFAANAMGTLSLVFYSGSYTRGYEVLDGVTMLDMTDEVDCAPCPIDESRAWCPGKCMDLITVDYVLNKVEEVIDGS